MIYVTGDCHGNFRRFTKSERGRLPFKLTENDYVIVCGDLGLLWAKDGEFKYNLKWFSQLPFTLLWVQGNHENYNMIAEYSLEEWHGGKVRHILQDKIILLERGQVFTIEDRAFFTFGGASSHDISGGILDKCSLTYRVDYKRAVRGGLPFRVLNESWWKQELPTEDELEEGRKNLAQVGYQVDFVISHCGSNRLQEALERFNSGCYKHDVLTDYFEELENKLQYKQWFCGHYHEDFCIDAKHTILYHKIIPIEERNGNSSKSDSFNEEKFRGSKRVFRPEGMCT